MSRIYSSLREMISEEHRNLREMGVLVKSWTWQGKDVHDNPQYNMKELVGNTFSLTKHDDLESIHQYMIDEYNIDYCKTWADAEFLERILPRKTNPGEAWKLRADIWGPHLKENILGKKWFDYTYSERMINLYKVIAELNLNPFTRRAILPIFSARDGEDLSEKKRIPCSMFYQFVIRNKTLDMIYTMRSCDFFTHFVNDVYLACKLQNYISSMVRIPPGIFTMFISSFHAFQKDLEKYKTY